MTLPTNPPVPTSRLFVGSLPFNFTEGELLSLFAPYGRITFIKIAHNQWGKSRGLGFVEFDNLASAIEAKKILHNYKIEERTIIVDFAQPDPFNTPEGQQRHHEAVMSKVKKFDPLAPRPSKAPARPASSPRPADRQFQNFNTPIPRRKTKSDRQSIFDSRNHHSRVGAKFAHKTKRAR